MPGSHRKRTRPDRPAAGGKPVMITGGAGFLGSNLADRLARQGQGVLIYDNLSRSGAEENLAWLRDRHGSRVQVAVADIRDGAAVAEAVAGAAMVFHFAAQVAVTTSLADPVADFEVNARGTLNLLEGMRRLAVPPPMVFASTNKVYGGLAGLRLMEHETCYAPEDYAIRRFGISETQRLELHSPYGCSKGAADQYVLDYARIFGLPAVVFRMSCLYGPRQFGTEDQGWVAHFLISALQDRPITVFGNGKQVRDVLHVDDVVAALLLVQEHMETVRGRAFNIGGGPGNVISLLDLLQHIRRLAGRPPKLSFAEWRPGDQAYYASDIRAFQSCTGWRPQVTAEGGVAQLFEWLRTRYGERIKPSAARGAIA